LNLSQEELFEMISKLKGDCCSECFDDEQEIFVECEPVVNVNIENINITINRA